MKLPENWSLPEPIKVRFGQTHGQQRAMLEEGHLLLILHELPHWGDRRREGQLFWRNPQGEWQFSGRGNGLPALRNHVKEYVAEEEELDRRYDAAKTASDYFRLLEDLAPVRLAARNLHHALQQAREGVPEDRDLIDLRDAAAECARNLELLYGSGKNALDFEIAKESERQARLAEQSVYIANRLNVIVAIFFPLTAIAGIFGMNLATGLETASPVLFWWVLVGGVVIGFVVRGWVLTKPGKEKP